MHTSRIYDVIYLCSYNKYRLTYELCFLTSCRYILLILLKVFIMNRLPNEILLMIFDKLPPQELHILSSVCKRWFLINRQRAQIVTKHRKLCVLSELRSLFITVPISDLILKLSFAPSLRSLTITANVPLKSDDIVILAKLIHLKHLDFFAGPCIITALPPQLNSVVINEVVTRDCMITLRNSMILKNLHYFGRGRAITAVQLASIIQYHERNLQELTLRCRELPSKAYQYFSECTQLIALRLYECWRLCKEQAVFVTRSNHLKVLHITGIRLMSSQSLGEFIKTFPSNLTEISLSASLLDDTHFDIIIETVPLLEVFEAWRCKYTPTGILKLTNGLQMLQILDIDIPLDNSDLHILDKHPKLKHVRCLYGDDIDKTFKIQVSNAGKKDGLIRNIGEGFRSDIFYYCNRNVNRNNLT